MTDEEWEKEFLAEEKRRIYDEGFCILHDPALPDPVLYYKDEDELYMWVSSEFSELRRTLLAAIRTRDLDVGVAEYNDVVYFALSWIRRFDHDAKRVRAWERFEEIMRETLQVIGIIKTNGHERIQSQGIVN
jgi:hypothetical protein